MSKTLIAEIPVEDDEVVRIFREDREDGRVRFHTRTWFRDAARKWNPGQHGMIYKKRIVWDVIAGLAKGMEDSQ